MEKQNKIRVLEFRILQLEIALGSLMQVVAFPEKNTNFRTRMEEAMKISEDSGIDNILNVILDEGGEA